MKQKQSNSVTPSEILSRQIDRAESLADRQFPGIDPKKLYRTKEVSRLTNFTESFFEAARFRGHGPALPSLNVLGCQFCKDRITYNMRLRQVMVRTFYDYLIEDEKGTVEQSKQQMRKEHLPEERTYTFGGWFSLCLRCYGGFKEHTSFASEMGEVLRAALHKGRSVEELQKEITAPGWDPRKARNEAREFLAATGLSATKRRENRKQKEAATAVEAEKAGSSSADEQESAEQTADHSSHEGTGGDDFEHVSGSSTEATEVETALPAGKPSRNAEALRSADRQELGVLEFDASSGRKVFRPLPPTEAIRIALDLLWLAKGLKACGHSPEVTTMIEAVIRLNRTPAP